MSKQVEEKEVVSYESDGTKKVTKTISKSVKSGVSFGSALAMAISFCTWKSVGWAYVIYYVIKY